MARSSRADQRLRKIHKALFSPFPFRLASLVSAWPAVLDPPGYDPAWRARLAYAFRFRGHRGPRGGWTRRHDRLGTRCGNASIFLPGGRRQYQPGANKPDAGKLSVGFAPESQPDNIRRLRDWRSGSGD